MIDALAHGVYLPIVIFSGIACWMLVWRLVIPAIRHRGLRLDDYAIGVSASFALGAHFFENVWYGGARWFGAFESLNNALVGVLAWKVLILASSVTAVAALSAAATDGPHIGRLAAIAAVVWAAASSVAWLL